MNGSSALGRLATILPDTVREEMGDLSIGGCRLTDLAAEYGTPLYVYDARTLEQTCRTMRTAFTTFPSVRLSFATKACAIPAILRYIAAQGFGLDCVSAGELAAARLAGIGPDTVHLHGNNKPDVDLCAALEQGVRVIVVDNREELVRLRRLAQDRGSVAAIMLRVALDIETGTHPHLHTGGRGTKFGFQAPDPSELSGELREALRLVAGDRNLRLVGLHTHMGSQISDPELYTVALTRLLALQSEVERILDAALAEIGIGGGWAVAYRPGDPELRASELVAALRTPAAASPYTLALEPGRAVVARAGMAVYRVGAVKGVHVVVDGGMGDNPRPALYGARYSALLPSRLQGTPTGHYDVVGRYCESGDFLARDVDLPTPCAGDLLSIPVAGAYQLAMASNYNLVPRPAVVLIDHGRPTLITRRETIEDMLAREIVQ